MKGEILILVHSVGSRGLKDIMANGMEYVCPLCDSQTSEKQTRMRSGTRSPFKCTHQPPPDLYLTLPSLPPGKKDLVLRYPTYIVQGFLLIRGL